MGERKLKSAVDKAMEGDIPWLNKEQLQLEIELQNQQLRRRDLKNLTLLTTGLISSTGYLFARTGPILHDCECNIVQALSRGDLPADATAAGVIIGATGVMVGYQLSRTVYNMIRSNRNS